MRQQNHHLLNHLKTPTHTKSHNSSPLSSKQQPEVHEPGLFQSSKSQLNHLKRYFYITKNNISYSLMQPHNFFSIHQTAVANSMHFQFTFTSHLQHLQSGVHLESSQTSVMGPFLEIYQPVEAVGYFPEGAPS